ncbi:peroxiredoxin [Algiphilus aromaticivorans]|jgi:peroxiredoxin|uniref:peroxiredoxin n=1 Tax=Algiphilus aromaticivorans TaxID=382454 RepID=UPI0005C25B5F|nr:peroxiredoxin [Algiphilus aromaticivorans]
MAINTGDKIPEAKVFTMGSEGPKPIQTSDIFAGKKVVLFGVPGAFTPGCSQAHLPGYVVKADDIKAKGVDTIVCMAVNDAFVMDAWGKTQNAENLLMVGDGNAEFTKAMGLEMDGSGFGLGTRCQRFAMIVDDGVVTHAAVEPKGEITVSSAESVLEKL